MKSNVLFFVFVFSLLEVRLSLASSCLGRGTVFFYGNGMFNTIDEARDSKVFLEEVMKQGFRFDKDKSSEFALAYKTSEPVLTQVKNVVVQKGIDNWENFWLWISSLKQAPEWFQKAMKLKAAEALKDQQIHFEDVREHFESYSYYLRQGYNVILVSHSQGNLYANQAMRKLSNYTDESLTGSLLDKRKKNENFPPFFDLFANIQVATPVSATVNASPWSTFMDDLIMELVRNAPGGALPANLKTLGSNIPLDGGPEDHGDPLGHSFVKAYLRNQESRSKILSDIQIQYNKLKYPIAYFGKAVILESHLRYYGDGDDLHTPDAYFFFTIAGPSDYFIDGQDEIRPTENEIIEQAFVYCNDLPLGTSKIYLSVDSHEKKEVSFEAWPQGKKKGVKPMVVTFPVNRGDSDWEVGTIQTEKGEGKEPLKVKVEIYPKPKPRKLEAKDL